MRLPLQGITVLEFSQYLAGPYAGLRLADLGARVIKIERPKTGDACRQLATKNIFVDGDSLVFHTINRNKESFAADLKNPNDLLWVRKLIASADVMTHNFRPGVMEKIGLDYDSVKVINPKMIYGEVTGYGRTGPWKDKPGQDLLAQSLSGLTWLTGSADDGPVPFGLATADMLCGTHLAQGLLAGLVKRGKTGEGSRIEVSLLESLLDLQFEVLTTHLNDGEKLPCRSKWRNAHASLGAPYGIYPTLNGYIAIAMGSIEKLSPLIEIPELHQYLQNSSDLFTKREEIKSIIAQKLKSQTTNYWLERLESNDYWASDVYHYGTLLQHVGYQVLQMEQSVERSQGVVKVKTTRCPIRIDSQRLYSKKGAPYLGSSNAEIRAALETLL